MKLSRTNEIVFSYPKVNFEDTMVLQLVLPPSQNSSFLIGDSLKDSLNDEISNNFFNPKPKNEAANILTQHCFYRSKNGCFMNQAYDISTSFTIDSLQTERDHVKTPGKQFKDKPTPIEEKNLMFREFLTKILSCMYGLFIVTLGIVVYISDIVIGSSSIAESFSLYLVLIALVFILCLIIDVNFNLKRRRLNFSNEVELRNKIKSSNNDLKNGQFYSLSKNKHSANFYLKIGAAGFCLGHLIHSGLLLGYQIVFLTSDGATIYQCATIATLILDFSYPLYSFLLLYFIFKYSNIIINRYVGIARFGLMHCISSSLCFWVWTILRETIESLSNHSYTDEDLTNHTTPVFVKDIPHALPLTSYNKKGAQLITDYLNNSVRSLTHICDGDQGLGVIYRNYSPYLYPFSVEYSILVVGVLFTIWQSIGPSHRQETSRQLLDVHESNVVLHADCHAANRGLFGGIVMIAVAGVSSILFLIAIDDEHLIEVGIFVNTITSIVIILLMTVTGILAYRQITKLDINTNHTTLLDDLLLFICIPAFFLNGIFSIIPAIISGNALSISSVLLEITQILVQTPLIIDGLRRCSNNQKLREKKPGRELLTFLIVCNVSMWIIQTFEIKSHGLQDHRYDFYGQVLWTIIGHMCMPLIMFYRFHSSVCIVDIWKYAYEPAS